MIFGGLEDSHDRRTQKIMDRAETTSADITNFNLVGIRRRLNNVEVGVWLIVFLLAAHVWRHW
jgi:flavin-binding protein dodecin